MKFIGVGDNVVDRYVNKRTMFPGGNTVNFSVYVSELGENSSYMGVLAGDREGLLIKESLEKKGVDISTCVFSKSYGTERCDVELNDGDRVFVGCNTGGQEHGTLILDDRRLRILEEFDVIHCSCYSDMEDEIVKLKNNRAVKTFDFSDDGEYRQDEYMKKICPYIDIALFSESGSSGEQMEKLKDKCLKLGTKMILMTKGKNGQVLYTKSGRYDGCIKEVDPVDTMGAGDSFFATFVVALIKNGWEKNAQPDEKVISKAFEAAAEFSAKNCLREGAFGFATKY